MTRSWQLLIVAGAPALIVAVLALSALLATRLAATPVSPATPTIQGRALAVTPDRGKTTPVRPAPVAISGPTPTLAPTTGTGASPSSSLGASCCDLTPAQPEETAPPRATMTETQAGVAIETLDGTTSQVAAPQDQVVAVVSMAVGCASCIQELQAWAEIYPAYLEDVTLVVLSINPFEDADTLRRVVATVGVDAATVAIDRDGEVSRALGIQSLDQTLIYDRAGQMTFSDAVPTSAPTLAEALDEALAG